MNFNNILNELFDSGNQLQKKTISTYSNIYDYIIYEDTKRHLTIFFYLPTKEGKKKEYIFIADHVYNDEGFASWDVHFGTWNSRKGLPSNKKTGFENAPLVFSSVVFFIKLFINKKHPPQINISCPEKDTSRFRLYKMMADNLSKEFGYKIHDIQDIQDIQDQEWSDDSSTTNMKSIILRRNGA